jgi:hypothetical protein
MDFEWFGKLLDQWRGALTAAGLLLTAAIGVWKQALDLNPRAWSWPELSFVFLAASMIAAVVLRSRDANASRLVEAKALKLDPQSPEQLIGRREDLDKLLKTLSDDGRPGAPRAANAAAGACAKAGGCVPGVRELPGDGGRAGGVVPHGIARIRDR